MSNTTGQSGPATIASPAAAAARGVRLTQEVKRELLVCLGWSRDEADRLLTGIRAVLEAIARARAAGETDPGIGMDELAAELDRYIPPVVHPSLSVEELAAYSALWAATRRGIPGTKRARGKRPECDYRSVTAWLLADPRPARKILRAAKFPLKVANAAIRAMTDLGPAITVEDGTQSHLIGMPEPYRSAHVSLAWIARALDDHERVGASLRPPRPCDVSRRARRVRQLTTDLLRSLRALEDAADGHVWERFENPYAVDLPEAAGAQGAGRRRNLIRWQQADPRSGLRELVLDRDDLMSQLGWLEASARAVEKHFGSRESRGAPKGPLSFTVSRLQAVFERCDRLPHRRGRRERLENFVESALNAAAIPAPEWDTLKRHYLQPFSRKKRAEKAG